MRLLAQCLAHTFLIIVDCNVTMVVMVTLISIILKDLFKANCYIYYWITNYYYPTQKGNFPLIYWEEECCLRAVLSFPFLSTAPLHFLLFPQFPAPPCTNNPSVPSGYSEGTIDAGFSEQYYQICTNAIRRMNVGQAHFPFALLLHFPPNHHYARMVKWFRLPWGLAMTKENYKRGMDCFLIISFIRLSPSTIKKKKKRNQRFTPTFWKAHSGSPSYSLNSGFPTTLLHIF